MEIDYNELFGVSENIQEAAEPEAAEAAAEEEGEKEQEIAEPASEEAEQAEESELQGEEAEAAENGKQTKERNAAFAAARRKAEAERDAAIEKAKADAKAEADRAITEFLQESGILNPYTKQPIKSKAEWDTYRERHTQEQQTALLKKSGMSSDEFNGFIANLPEVKAAREVKAQAEREKEAAMQAQAKLKVDRQIEEIGKLDPSIKTIQDLTASKNYQAVYEKVKQGYTLTDAFKLANWDALQKSAAQAAAQTARNIGSKGHMAAHGTRGSGAAPVPADIMEEYRAFNPGMSDAEITAHYNKYLKK